MEVCRPEDKQYLLLSHICKILVEYAVDNARNQVLVNPQALCSALRKAINGQTPTETAKYCIDALVALARCFEEAKATFLELAKDWHHKCADLLNQPLSSAGVLE